jgi:hypothetical protein
MHRRWQLKINLKYFLDLPSEVPAVVITVASVTADPVVLVRDPMAASAQDTLGEVELVLVPAKDFPIVGVEDDGKVSNIEGKLKGG